MLATYPIFSIYSLCLLYPLRGGITPSAATPGQVPHVSSRILSGETRIELCKQQTWSGFLKGIQDGFARLPEYGKYSFGHRHLSQTHYNSSVPIRLLYSLLEPLSPQVLLQDISSNRRTWSAPACAVGHPQLQLPAKEGGSHRGLTGMHVWL